MRAGKAAKAEKQPEKAQTAESASEVVTPAAEPVAQAQTQPENAVGEKAAASKQEQPEKASEGNQKKRKNGKKRNAAAKKLTAPPNCVKRKSNWHAKKPSAKSAANAAKKPNCKRQKKRV